MCSERIVLNVKRETADAYCYHAGEADVIRHVAAVIPETV